MDPSSLTQRWMVITSLVCAAAVGAVTILESALGDTAPTSAALWWVCYAVFVVVLLLMHGFLPTPRALSQNVLLLTFAALAIGLALLFPRQTWMAVLFVLTTAMAAFSWRPRAVAALVVIQTAAVVAMGVLAGWSLVDVLMGVLAFGNMQVFGALVVFTARSEAEARHDLTVALAELRSTTALLDLTSREAERLRISRELHDLTGHDLTALSLELEVAAHLTASTDAGHHVVRARTIAKDLLTSVRAAVSRIREETPSLDDAVRHVTGDTPGLDVLVEVEEVASLGAEQTIAIVRGVQEAITNALRHAQADHLWVRVGGDEQEVCVSIHDDGVGAATITPGNGLRGMRERFEALGGTLEARSHSAGGFAIRGRFPVAQPTT